MSSTIQSTDYKREGVKDVCEMKKKFGKVEDGKLTKSLSRKVFDIISDAEDVRSVIPDLAYLAARNDGLDPNTELGYLISRLIDMINKGVNKGDLIKYMEGVVMAVYVIEEAKENDLDPYKFLGC